MYCNKCGKGLPDEAMFCKYCGAKLNWNVSDDDSASAVKLHNEVSTTDTDYNYEIQMQENILNQLNADYTSKKEKFDVWRAACLGIGGVAALIGIIGAMMLKEKLSAENLSLTFIPFAVTAGCLLGYAGNRSTRLLAINRLEQDINDCKNNITALKNKQNSRGKK
ncbi:MAG: zinc ribbon domain-containing protein [Clostridia bacterium]|nr:zinc ribbon domain-containing protein [Clostridia bacterium]